MLSRNVSFYSPTLSLIGNSIHGNILHIPFLSRESSGEYECQASNGMEPTAKKKIFISVRGILWFLLSFGFALFLESFFVIFFDMRRNSLVLYSFSVFRKSRE